MKHSRWIHIACIAGPLVAVILLVAGVDRGLALLVWLVCPIAMVLMMRHMSGSTHQCEHDAARRDGAQAQLSGASSSNAEDGDGSRAV